MGKIGLAVLLVACAPDASAPPVPMQMQPHARPPRAARVETAPAPTPSPAFVPSGRLTSASLRERPSDETVELVRGDHAARPIVFAMARLGDDAGDEVLYVLYGTSESRDQWARLRTDGTYDDQRRQLETAIRGCADDGCYGCESCEERMDTERFPRDVQVHLARISHRAGGSAVLDARHQLYRPRNHAAARFRPFEDSDGDGRQEISIAISDTYDTGQFGEQTVVLTWLDGDTLHPQLSFERAASAFGCTGSLSERSGFSFRDRNGDGRADVGVRHAVWSAGCEADDGWPSPSGTRLEDPGTVRGFAMGDMAYEEGEEEPEPAPECPYFEERVRYLYDAAADEWREAPDA